WFVETSFGPVRFGAIRWGVTPWKFGRLSSTRRILPLGFGGQTFSVGLAEGDGRRPRDECHRQIVFARRIAAFKPGAQVVSVVIVRRNPVLTPFGMTLEEAQKRTIGHLSAVNGESPNLNGMRRYLRVEQLTPPDAEPRHQRIDVGGIGA